MANKNLIYKATYGILITATILFSLIFLVKTGHMLAESPLFSYIMFTIFCLTLCVWSYRKLKNEFIVFSDVNNEIDSLLPTVIKKAPKYQKIRIRHTWYFIILSLIWYIIFVGDKPHYDEEGYWCQFTVLSNLAIEYFGSVTTFDGFKEFHFKSSLHMILFYFLNILPFLILAIGGSMIYKMSEDRLFEEQKTEDSL